MRKLYTSGITLLCACLLSACASLPGSGGPGNGEPGRSGDNTERAGATTNAPAEGQGPRAALPAAAVVKTPPLKSGNRALFDRAVQLMRDNKYSAAQVLLLELTDDQPELAGPWVNLGHTYLVADDMENALQSFQRAVQANDKNCDALNQLGVLARQRGEFDAAEQFYQRCIKAQPMYADAYLNLGILYELYMGRLGEALAAYNDYQIALPEPDNQVAGWVLDLERRVGAIAKR